MTGGPWRQGEACDRGDAAGSGQGFAGRAGGRGVSFGGDSGSCGTLDSWWRSAEQESGGGDAFDEMHGSATHRAMPLWC